MISNSGSDERGQYHGGKLGDNNLKEWRVMNWYSYPWLCVLRYPDRNVANKIAELSRKAANNNMIGYDQYKRHTYWEHLKASNYDPSKITIPCADDCSAGVLANVKATGVLLNIPALANINENGYTGIMRRQLMAAGFQLLTASKYLTSDKYLLPGDVLLNDSHHTAVNLDIGIYAEAATVKPTVTPSKQSTNNTGKLQDAQSRDKSGMNGKTFMTTDNLNMRYGAGTNFGIIQLLSVKTKVTWYGYYSKDSVGTKWYLVVAPNGKVGYCSSKYLR